MHSNVQDIVYSVIPKESYLTYGYGTIPLVLSAPHGGNTRPISIPNRVNGTKVKDTYTRRLIEYLITRFKYAEPFYIYADIHRCKVDLNRNLRECCENEKAEKIWGEWNVWLDMLLHGAKQYDYLSGNKCLYIDIHSHNDGDYFELGYNLSAKNYIKLFNEKEVDAPTTLDSLEKNKYDMIFGESSFYDTINKFGYKTFFPTGNEVYFNGGRNVEHFSGDGVGAIQIEVPVSYLKQDLKRVGKVLDVAIVRFIEKYL